MQYSYIIIIIIIILGLCYHFSPLWRNPSLDSFHWCPSRANLVQVVPRYQLRSSPHLVFGLPRGLNHLRGTQDVALMVHLLSWKSGYMTCPLVFRLSDVVYDVCHSCLLLDPGVMSLVAKGDAQHNSLHFTLYRLKILNFSKSLISIITTQDISTIINRECLPVVQDASTIINKVRTCSTGRVHHH